MKLSVIVPVHNGDEDLRVCLNALAASSRTPDQVIVVDDASTDSSVELAHSLGAQVILTPGGPHGPAMARNRGAGAACGDVLVFVDADVAVHSDTLGIMEKYLAEQPEIAALFGSYDDAPPQRGLVTLYKNLQHHFVHQHSQREASTFWAGAGAIRRDIFVQLGGFDERYVYPSIEDIELGVRMRQAGFRVQLCPDAQVTHLKSWSLFSLLRADILRRAVPWTQLILSNAQLPSDLNLDLKSRLSAFAAWGFLLFLALGFWSNWFWVGALFALGVIISLNADLYRFFIRQGGIRFTVGAFGLHLFYFLYSSLVFGAMLAWHVLQNFKGIRRSHGEEMKNAE